jgi:hypothetical protein
MYINATLDEFLIFRFHSCHSERSEESVFRFTVPRVSKRTLQLTADSSLRSE